MRHPLSVYLRIILTVALAVPVLLVPLSHARGEGDEEPFVVTAPQPVTGRPELAVLPEQRAAARLTVFSPDSKKLAVGGTGVIFLWDLTTGQCVSTLSGHAGDVNALAFSADGKRLASGGEDHAVKVWDLETGRETLTLARHKDRVTALAFSPDGKRLASGSDDKTVILWDTATGEAVKVITDHAGGLTAAAFSPDGKWLATGGLDKRMLLWDFAGGNDPPKAIEQKDAVAALAFSPDSQALAAAVGPYTGGEARFGLCEVTLWNAGAWDERKKLPPVGAGLTALAFTPDGTGVVTATFDRTLVIWDAARALERQVSVGQTPSPDLARSVTRERDGIVTVWNLQTRRVFVRCVGLTGGGWLCATSEGYYGCSEGADARIGWRFGVTTYACDRFAARFNKPELPERALAGEDLSREPALDGTLLPPNIAFAAPRGDTEITEQTVDLQIQTAGLHPITRIELTVNGKPGPPEVVKALTFEKPEKPRQAVKLEYRLPLDETRFRLRVVSYDTEGMQSAPAEVTLYLPGAREAAERLFVLCVAVNRFKAPEIPSLRFAVQDAEAFAKLFTEHKLQPPCAKGFTVKMLTEKDATATAVTAAINEIKASAGPRDMVIIYLATHRVRDTAGNLFLASYDLNMTDLRRTAVDWRTLTGLINNIATPQVLVLADVGRSAEHPTAKALDAQLHAFYAVNPDELGVSQWDWGHGAFALALLEGLGGKADAGANGVITFGELNDYVAKRVEELSEGRQHPQWPALEAKMRDIPLTWIALPRLNNMTVDELTKILQDGETDVKRRDNTGRTLLHWATAANRAELAELLLERGADANAADNAGETPLHVAASAGLRDVAGKLLAKGADLNLRDKENRTPFEMARIYDQSAMMDLFLPAAAPNSRDETGKTPLHLAVVYNRPKVVQQMLPKYANLNVGDDDGNTPLHLAAAKGLVQIAGLLLDKDANANAANKPGATPLHLAVAQNQAKMVSFLLERGAKIDAPDGEGRTPLHWTVDGETLEMIDLLAARGVNLNLGDKDGVAPLSLAVNGGKLAAAKQLLLRGADVNVRDKSFYAPLHWAATQESPEMLKLLLAYKPSLNPHDKDGYTPLHAAAWYNRVDNITLLLAAGAPINDKNKAGQTPLALAKKNNAKEAAELLQAKGGF